MPTYDYICDACGATFQAEQRMSDPPLTTCTVAGCAASGTVRRLVGGGAGFIFKGSGFYVTDYKNGGAGAKDGGGKDGANGAAKESKGDAAAPASGESKSGESKGGGKKSGESKGDSAGDAKPAAAPATGSCGCGQTTGGCGAS